ncbi:glycosylated lysosomal membrane protein [Nilaparvata lugens]|uniref:glycosylated lysosomal membrane protein n=1 Tax=Nilaparvata lugens TaxID=108931 RepID=UPI00193D8258|nr:glycosylated lysosomal membrane protein [Nilaparvata lugens]
MKTLKLSLLFIVFFKACISAQERKLSTFVNPGCALPASGCDDLLLVHIRSEGANDTLHHIWDVSRQPSLMLALTDRNCSLLVNWTSYASNHVAHSISFTSQPKYVISVVVDAIIEFNDTDDMGKLDVSNAEADYVRLMKTDQVSWKMVQPMTNDTNTVLLAVEGHPNNTDTNVTAPIQISMGAFGGVERGSRLPHMLHSANMSQMDITLDHLATRGERSRLGVSLVVVTSSPNQPLSYHDKAAIDDEYAPGVFKMVELLSAGAREQKFEPLDKAAEAAAATSSSPIQYGGYLQWRPIAYTAPTRDDSQATRATHYGIAHAPTADAILPFKLFGNDSGALYQTTNVTFGQPEDGFYNKTRFASWSVTHHLSIILTFYKL